LNPTGVKEVEKLVGQLQIAEAIEYCEKNPSPITNIIGSGLARADIREIDVQAVESAMEEASVEEFATPYVFINYLSVIASLAPMMGLYGTVSGMVKAFNTIPAEGAGSASKLADNISEALITTATGMIVGIPAMFFFFLFKQSYGKIISSSSRIIGDIVYTMKVAIKYGPQEVEAEEATAEAPVEEAPAETQE
jgi:biopolymer transport protein ExbB